MLLPIRLTAASSSPWRRPVMKTWASLLHKPLGRGKAYAAVSACNDRNFPFQPFHGIMIVMAGFKFVKLSEDAFAA
jgi:hypothetical protein